MGKWTVVCKGTFLILLIILNLFRLLFCSLIYVFSVSHVSFVIMFLRCLVVLLCPCLFVFALWNTCYILYTTFNRA